jgi:hypothetical protein
VKHRVSHILGVPARHQLIEAREIASANRVNGIAAGNPTGNYNGNPVGRRLSIRQIAYQGRQMMLMPDSARDEYANLHVLM